jgi:hypothetical protein
MSKFKKGDLVIYISKPFSSSDERYMVYATKAEPMKLNDQLVSPSGDYLIVKVASDELVNIHDVTEADVRDPLEFQR